MFFSLFENYITSFPLANQPHPLLPPWNLTSTTKTQTHLHLDDPFLPSDTVEEEDHLCVSALESFPLPYFTCFKFFFFLPNLQTISVYEILSTSMYVCSLKGKPNQTKPKKPQTFLHLSSSSSNGCISHLPGRDISL